MKQIQLAGPLLLGDSIDYLINYVKKEDFSVINQFYVIAIFLIYENFLDRDNFIAKLKESSHLPISIIIFILGDNQIDLDNIQAIYNEHKEESIRKNIIIKNFHDIYKNLVRVKLSFEVIFRPIENSILKEISNQVKNCYK